MTTTNIPSLGHVLVTGGCGFVGHHMVRLILERHPKSLISVLDLTTTHNRISSQSVTYFDGDLTNTTFIRELLASLKPDVVIHTASPRVWLAREVLYKVNVTGTKELIAASQEAGVKAFVYTSSSSVVMPKDLQAVNVDERWPYKLGSDSPEYYSETKALAEKAVLAANRTTEYPNFFTAAIRPAGIFGEGDVQFVPNVLAAARRGNYKFQIGDNTNLFDCTYVENVVHGHLLAVIALLETHKRLPSIPLDMERVDGEAFFITNESPVYFWDFPRAISKAAGYDVPSPNQVWVLSIGTAMFIGAILEWVFWILGRKATLTRSQVVHSVSTRLFCIDKAKRRLGYSPVVSLEEGIRRTGPHARKLMEAEAAKK